MIWAEPRQNYTMKAAAPFFGVTDRTLLTWIREGKIFKKVIDMPDGYLIPGTEINRILEERSFNPQIEQAPNKETKKRGKPGRRVISDGIR
jgi:hypothetical protein